MLKLFIDTETSGLSPRLHKTLTVGLLATDVEESYLDIIDEGHILVKHDDYNANPFAMRVNKINLDEHHKIAIKPKKACQKINSFVKENKLLKTPLVGHNIPFDRNFVNALFIQGQTSPKLSNIQEDTRMIWKNLQLQGKVPSDLRAKLGTLADYFGVDYSKAHNALDDCHITSKVYQEMLKL